MTLETRSKLPEELWREAREVLADPDLWIDTPHEQLGGLAPSELIDRGVIAPVRDLLRAIRQGDFT